MGQSRDSKPVFTCQEIEQHLQSALAAATPDVWSRLDLSIPQEQAPDTASGKIWRLEAGRAEIDPLADGPEGAGQSVTGGPQRKESGPKPGKGGPPGQDRWERLRARTAGLGRTSRRWGAAAAACICLLAAGGGYYHYSYLQVASSVEIDVNPSLRLFLNRREKVLQVQALNEDGAELMDGSRLKGQPVGTAVDQVLDALVEKGYLGQDGQEHAILVSVSGRDVKKAERLKAEVSADVESALEKKEVRAVVYDQTVRETEALKELAQTYQVSVGKAGFVEQLIAENEDLDPDSQEVYSQLMGQTMEELTQEIGEKDYQVGQKITVVRTRPQEDMPRMADASKGERRQEREPDRPKAGQDPADERAQGPEPEEKGIDDTAVLASGQPEEEQTAVQQSAEAPAESTTGDGMEGGDTLFAALSEEPPREAEDPGAFQESIADQTEESEASLEGQVHIEEEEPPALSEEQGLQPTDPTDPSDEGLDESDRSQELGQPAETASSDEDEGTPPSQDGDGQATVGEADQMEESIARPVPDEGEMHPSEEESPPVETEEQSVWEESDPETSGTEIDPPKVHHHETREEDQEEEMEDEMEEEDADTVSQIIRNTSDEWSILAPGDIKTPEEMGQMTAPQREHADGKAGAWREPVYASEFMSSAERRFLQKGPGAFSSNASEGVKKEILWFGPGFAFLNESTRDLFTQLFEGNDR